MVGHWYFIKVCLLLLLMMCQTGNSYHRHREQDFLLPSRAGRLNNKLTFACLSWTPWISVDTPTYSGDWETLSLPYDMGTPGTIHSYSQYAPICTVPVSVQCRSRIDNTSWTDLYDELKIPCRKDLGLVCRTRDQPDNRMCHDYELRFLCWSTCPYFEWSHWIDYNNPDGQGDIEILGQTISRENWPCSGGEIPVDVQCETLTGIPLHQSKKKGLQCYSLGFVCLNGMQEKDCSCDDFKVRFLCPLKDKFPDYYKRAPLYF